MGKKVERKRLKRPITSEEKPISNGHGGSLPYVKKRQVPEWVKRAADRAERRARGEDPWEEERKPLRVRVVDIPDPPLDDEEKPMEPKRKIERRRLIGSKPRREEKLPTRTIDRTSAMLASTYDPEYHPKRAAELVLNGATDRDLIVEFHINRTVLSRWMTQYPEFAAACKISREASLADARVERSVYEMANGYYVPAVKIMQYKGEVIKVPYKKYIPKDLNAAKYWLINRDPANWGRGAESSQNNDDKTPTTINVNMLRSMSTEQLHNVLQVLKGLMSPNQALGRLDQMKINNDDMIEDAEVIENETD